MGQLSANNQPCSPPAGPRQPLHQLSPANDGRGQAELPQATATHSVVTAGHSVLAPSGFTGEQPTIFQSIPQYALHSCLLLLSAAPLFVGAEAPQSWSWVEPRLEEGRCQPSTTPRSPGWDVCGRRKDFWVLSPAGAHSVAPRPGRGPPGPQDTLPPTPPAHPGVETLRGEKPRITREGVRTRERPSLNPEETRLP